MTLTPSTVPMPSHLAAMVIAATTTLKVMTDTAIAGAATGHGRSTMANYGW